MGENPPQWSLEAADGQDVRRSTFPIRPSLDAARNIPGWSRKGPDVGQNLAKYSGEVTNDDTTELKGIPEFITTVQKLSPEASPLRLRKAM